MRVGILQESISHYRVPVFEFLGAIEDLDVTVIVARHSVEEVRRSYNVLVCNDLQVGPLYWTRGLGKVWRSFDVMIVPLDLRWVRRSVLVRSKVGPRVVWWGHGFGRSAIGNLIRRYLLPYGESVVLYSDTPFSEFEVAGVPRDSIFVAHNTVHVPNAGVDREAKRDQFLYVGRLQKRKRIDEAIRAFARAELDGAIRLAILGDGEIRDELRTLAEEQGVEARVRFIPGTTDPKQLRAEFARSLAYVSPGAVGLGVLHSFAYGIPVITQHRAGHGPEFSNISDGVNGLLYDGTQEGLIRGMEALARRGYSLSLGEAAYEHYSTRRTIDVMAQAMINAIRWAARGNDTMES